jgi:alpha-tubulin suppressor-like RCC1 family protein
LTADGTAYCWGSNTSGQLGTSDPLPNCGLGPCSASPKPVDTPARFVTLQPGGAHACGITTDHRVLCWGNNAAGQLGNGLMTNAPTPVEVAGNLRVP